MVFKNLQNGKIRRGQGGFSFIELVIVIALIGIVFTIVMSQIGFEQVGRARDAKRKDHLKRIADAFEEYYNDYGQYPPHTILSNCGGSELSPYINQVPCDPGDGSAYVYQPYPDNTNRRAYRVYTALEKGESDQAVEDLGCLNGCMSPPLDPKYNYGVAQGVPVSN